MRWALLFILFLATTCFGEPGSFLSGVSLPLSESRTTSGELKDTTESFLHPTEHNPIDSMPVIKDTPAGAYVSVGFERSFIGAALAPNADHLVILDRDPRVIAMANFNAGLLALAKNRVDYMELRMIATGEEIAARAKESKIASDYAKALADPHLFTYFKRVIRNGSHHFHSFSALHEPPPTRAVVDNLDYAYRGANYLYDPRLFEKLSRMAKAGNISALECDLANAKSLNSVATEMHAKQVGLSVLDVSDTWYHARNMPYSFLPREKSLELWRAFAPLTKPTSVVLMTGWYPNPEPQQDPRGMDYWPWIYFGMTYDKVNDLQYGEQALSKMLNYYQRWGAANPRWQGSLNFPTWFDSVCRFFSIVPFRH